MIEVAAMAHPADDVVFTGVDLFELRLRKAGRGLSLKLVHRRLAATGAKIRLLPGDPYMALSRAVNMLGAADLVVIAADQDRAALERCWFYVERCCTLVARTSPGAREGARRRFRLVPSAKSAAARPRPSVVALPDRLPAFPSSSADQAELGARLSVRFAAS